MKPERLFSLIVLLMVVLFSAGCSKKEGAKTGGEVKIPEAPAAFADRHIPEGWWTDEKVIAGGKELYEGRKNMDVNCAACHGMGGLPLLTGARDFRDASIVGKWSDGYWFWRVSEGVADTAMTGWKEKLSEEEIWQVIAYSRTFSQGGKGQ